MKFMFSFIFTVLIIIRVKMAIVIESASDGDLELEAVAVFYRHGDRSPTSSFPTDKYFDLKYWPMGFGQLTNSGKRRHYNLGKWLRKRYNAFLPSEYSNKDIYIYSTDVDRTLMSAYVNLAGLYPPKNDQIWNKHLHWQPIPVHTMSHPRDTIIIEKRNCSLFDKLLNQVDNNDFFKHINEKFSDLYRYLSRKTGLNINNVHQIQQIRSVFYVYKHYNTSFIPKWADALNQTHMDYLAGLSYQSKTYTHQMKRLRIGPFYKYLLDYMNDVVKASGGMPKFLMISGHDTCLSSALNAMGVFDLYPPGFANTIIWEMRKSNENDGRHYINVLYKTDEELKKLHIKGCDNFDCDFEKFVEIMSKVAVDINDWNRECENNI